MNIYKVLNEITLYIENHLDEAIDYNDLCKMMGVNVYTFQRIFSLITNISLAEYIRKRRLSNAAVDLYSSNMKVIDVAIKYQYENATSFSRAFESFHGLKPSQVKKGSHHFKNFTRITFNENVSVNNEVEYEIIELDEMVLFGFGIKTNEENIKVDAPNLWDEAEKNMILKEYGIPVYGMTLYENRFYSEKLEYWILWDSEISGFDKIIIPKSKWLLFHTPTMKAIDIQENIDKVFDMFLPSSKFNIREIPELEYYHDGVTDILIPIE